MQRGAAEEEQPLKNPAELKKPSEKVAPEIPSEKVAPEIPSSPEEEVPPGQPDPKIDEIKHAQMQVHEIEVPDSAIDIDVAVEMALQTDLQNLKEAGVALFDASGGDENKAVELMFQMHAEHVAQQAAQVQVQEETAVEHQVTPAEKQRQTDLEFWRRMKTQNYKCITDGKADAAAAGRWQRLVARDVHMAKKYDKVAGRAARANFRRDIMEQIGEEFLKEQEDVTIERTKKARRGANSPGGELCGWKEEVLEGSGTHAFYTRNAWQRDLNSMRSIHGQKTFG